MGPGWPPLLLLPKFLSRLVYDCIAPFINIPRSNIAQIVNGCWCNKTIMECMMCASVRKVIHSLKLVNYLRVQTHTPYYNLHASYEPIHIRSRGVYV